MNLHSRKSRPSWSGQLAFILAAAASAIGLGNVWRFPYLAAQYGGGLFLLIYVLMVVTLGFTLMTTEVAIGRRTRLSGMAAFSGVHRGWKSLGWLVTLIPVIIVPYYCVIGGWILKYIFAYLFNRHLALEKTVETVSATGEPVVETVTEIVHVSSPDFFSAFIAHPWQPAVFGSVFILFSMWLIFSGVRKGIERSNKIMMPLLFILAIVISVFALFQPGALAGLKFYLLPNLSEYVKDGSFDFVRLCKTCLGAMGQMFYSLSLAMGIMITYGSYMQKTDRLERSVRRIEILDTLVAFLAGLMIIPIAYALGNGPEVMQKSGPGLLFVALPQIFTKMTLFGLPFGRLLGAAFFILVFFAAATSAVSLLETVVASIRDRTGVSRRTASILTLVYTLLMALPSALGYGHGPLGGVIVHGMTFLDLCDYVTNNVMMPIAAFFTCLFVGWAVGSRFVEEEVEYDGHPFRAKAFYRVMIRWIAPVLMFILFVTFVASGLGYFSI